MFGNFLENTRGCSWKLVLLPLINPFLEFRMLRTCLFQNPFVDTRWVPPSTPPPPRFLSGLVQSVYRFRDPSAQRGGREAPSLSPHHLFLSGFGDSLLLVHRSLCSDRARVSCGIRSLLLEVLLSHHSQRCLVCGLRLPHSPLPPLDLVIWNRGRQSPVSQPSLCLRGGDALWFVVFFFNLVPSAETPWPFWHVDGTFCWCRYCSGPLDPHPYVLLVI